MPAAASNEGENTTHDNRQNHNYDSGHNDVNTTITLLAAARLAQRFEWCSFGIQRIHQEKVSVGIASPAAKAEAWEILCGAISRRLETCRTRLERRCL